MVPQILIFHFYILHPHSHLIIKLDPPLIIDPAYPLNQVVYFANFSIIPYHPESQAELIPIYHHFMPPEFRF